MSKHNNSKIEHLHQNFSEKEITILSDAELLSVLINNEADNISSITVAKKLLKKFGSIRNIFDADPK